MTAPAHITVNGHAIEVPEGISVAAAIARSGQPFRHLLTGNRRAPLCGMGACFECRACIDGVAQLRTCLATVRDGMHVETE